MTKGRIVDYDGACLTIVAPYTSDVTLQRLKAHEVDIRILDGRQISVDQRRKAHALLRDIALYTGDAPEDAKDIMKYEFISRYGVEPFSLADVSVSTAREFISFLIDFCLEWHIPCRDSLLNISEDVSRYLYKCLATRTCAVCGRPADVHHVDAIGMGHDRRKKPQLGNKAVALCRRHHGEAHTMGWRSFENHYHLYGIKLDEYLCDLLGLPK